MKSDNSAMVVLGAVLLAIVIAIVGYFVLISPQLSSASSASEEADLAAQDNELLELQVLQLQALAEEVPTWEAEVELVREQMPPTAESASLTQLVSAAANEAGVPVLSIAMQSIQLLDSADLGPAPQPASEEPVDDGEGPGDGATPSPEPATPESGDTDGTEGTEDAPETDEPSEEDGGGVATVPFEGLVAIEFAVSTEGPASNVTRFLEILNEQQERYITVASLSILQTGAVEATPGRVALPPGSWTTEVSGVAFVLIDPDQPLEIDEEGGVPEVSGNPTNPFVPLV